jgi:hypothetical protein
MEHERLSIEAAQKDPRRFADLYESNFAPRGSTVREPACRIEDPFGNQWYIGSPIS